MKRIREYINANRYVLILVYWIFHFCWYQALQSVTMGRDPFPISCAADRLIPFSEWFILPYILWYVQIAAVSVYLLLKNKEVFTRLYIYMFGGMFVCMTICTVIPMYFDRTGIAMYPNDNLLTDCVRLVQGIDPPTTVLPSMHVFVTVGLHAALAKDKAFAENRPAVFASAFFAAVVCAATVFTKQHSVCDVAAAIPLCAVMYCAAYLPRYGKLFRVLRVVK